MRMSSTRALPALLLAVLMIVLGGCGGDNGGGPGGGGDDDPASVLPPGAVIAANMDIGPGSEQGKAALAFAEKIDPRGRDLSRELVKSINEDSDSDDDGYDFDYARDLEPWLGEKAALSFTSFEGEGGEGAGAIQIKDGDAAKEFFDRVAKSEKDKRSSYSEVDYAVPSDEGDGVYGIVGDFFVVASDEAQFKRSVDASKGDSLAEDKEYTDAAKEAPDGSLMVGVVQAGRFIEALEARDDVPRQTIEQIRSYPGFSEDAAATLAAKVEDDKAIIETVGPKGDTPEGGPKLADLPGDAWLAFAGPIASKQLTSGLDEGLRQPGGAQARQLLQRFGVLDFLGQVDGISLRVGGQAVLNINGKLTLSGGDQAAASKLVRAAGRELRRQAPSEIIVRPTADGVDIRSAIGVASIKASDGDIEVTVGEQPDAKFGDQGPYKSAAEALDLGDDGAQFVLDFAGVAKLLENTPQASSDPDARQAQEVLDKLGVLAGGSEVDGDTARNRIVLTLR